MEELRIAFKDEKALLKRLKSNQIRLIKRRNWSKICAWKCPHISCIAYDNSFTARSKRHRVHMNEIRDDLLYVARHDHGIRQV